LSYRVAGARASLFASGQAGGTYYASLEGDDRYLTRYSGSLGASFQLGASTSLGVTQSLSRQPYYLLASFPPVFEGEPGVAPPVPPVDAGAGVRTEQRLFSATAVSLTQGLGRRASFFANYGGQFYASASGAYDANSQSGGAGFRFALARGLGLRLGYAYAEFRFGDPTDADRTRSHTADVGIDYSRALSFSRRTSLAFSTGTSAVVYQDQTHYNVTGNLRLAHEIGRTWQASIGYTRGVVFLDTLREPGFADSVTLGIGGMANRRVRLQASLSGAAGNAGFGAGAADFNTAVASTSMQVGLSRYAGLSFSYAYYRHWASAGAVLAEGVRRQIDRQSLQVSINLWAPLVNGARRSDASR
jgi:hypothetical protein